MAKPNQKPIDWDAIERDHATGKYTDGELAAKHNVARETIARRRSRDQKKDASTWRKDLREKVRTATAALLLHAEVTAGSQQVTGPVTGVIKEGQAASAILQAAEIGKQVILQHRTELRETRELAMALLAEVRGAALLDEHREVLAEVLAGEGAQALAKSNARQAVRRALETGNRVSSVKALAETLTKLHAGERVAFSLDEEDGGKKKDDLHDLDDAELDRRINERLDAHRAA